MLSDIEQELIHIRNNYEDINRYITVADEWEGMYSKNMIKGKLLGRIKYIGLPSVWLSELFN